jgi:hypothetical protein
MIGQNLYDLTPRDLQVTPIEIVNRSIVVQALSTLVTVNGDVVPVGKLLMLRSLSWVSLPATGQILTQSTASVFDNFSAAIDYNFMLRTSADGILWGASVCDAHMWTGEIIVPPGRLLTASAQFNSGAALNTVRLSYSGILIPRGNVAI